MNVTANPPKPASIFRTVKTVAWAFLGIRKNKGFQQDIESVTPLQIVVVGLVAVVLLVGLLIGLVNWIV